jgi:monoterpene epsilon-lactone hydrolase
MTFVDSLRAAVIAFGICLPLAAQSSPASQADSASFDADGTAHVTRVIPPPSSISPEAQKWLASLAEKKSQPQTLAERRHRRLAQEGFRRGTPALSGER